MGIIKGMLLLIVCLVVNGDFWGEEQQEWWEIFLGFFSERGWGGRIEKSCPVVNCKILKLRIMCGVVTYPQRRTYVFVEAEDLEPKESKMTTQTNHLKAGLAILFVMIGCCSNVIFLELLVK